MKLKLLVSAVTAASLAVVHAADLYWDANGAASGTGGSGNWPSANLWRSGSDTGTLGTWSSGDNAILAGTAGTVTLGTSGSTNIASGNVSIDTTGYKITSTSASRNLVASGSLTLASNVDLTLDLANSGGTWGFGAIGFGIGSSLLVQGTATINNANRVNLSTVGTISGGSILLAGTGVGPTGFVSTVGGVTLNTSISNSSSTSATMLGANSGQLLTYGGVLSGSANLQISAGQSGGAGTVVLSNNNTYTGNTYLNSSSTGVLRIATDNALPAGTKVFFAQSAGGGTADSGGTIDLNGFSQTVAALDGAGRGVVNTTNTASTLTIGTTSGSNSFSGVIGIPSVTTNIGSSSNAISLVKNGASSQILTGDNTYSGDTDVNAGTLVIDGAHGGTGLVNVANGAVFGGTGSIAGSLNFEIGARFLFNATTPFTVTGTDVTFGGFGIGDLLGLNSAVDTGSYQLVSGGGSTAFDYTNLSNKEFGNAFDLGSGKSAYFDAQTGGLSVVVVPEPSAALLAGLGVLALLRRRRA